MTISHVKTFRNRVTALGTLGGILAFVTAILCADTWSAELVDEAWGVLDIRRIPAIRLNEHGYGDSLAPLRGLKLTEDSFVLTLEGTAPARKKLYMLAELCQEGDEVWVNDATLLREDEEPEQFLEGNLRFVVPTDTDKHLRFVKCMKPGMSMTQEERTHEVFIIKSEDRVISYLYRWVRFLAKYQNDHTRAGQFLTLALRMQTDVLSVLVSTPKAEELDRHLAFFDHTEPLAAFDAGMTPSAMSTDVLQRYLQVVTHARRKLLLFYPQHKARLEKELALLAKLREAPTR